MIVQVKKQCKRKGCGSWYRKKYGPKYYCNKCGLPDKDLIDNEKEKPISWEDRIRAKAEKEEGQSKPKKESGPDAEQMELDL